MIERIRKHSNYEVAHKLYQEEEREKRKMELTKLTRNTGEKFLRSDEFEHSFHVTDDEEEDHYNNDFSG